MVNHDGREGTAPDPLVWSAGARPKRRRLVHAIRDRAFLTGPPGIWDSECVTVPVTAICDDDIAHWPYTPGLLVKWVSFLGTLHWPADECDLGVGGVSYVELLILYEPWAGERLQLEKAVPRYRRHGRSISVSPVPFGPGADIWRSCRFLGALFRGLRDLPFGLRRIVSCDIGAVHCRLRHIGWERCGHGLTSTPRESASEGFLDKLSVLLVIQIGLLLLYWLVTYPFGIVLPDLLGSCPLGGFLTGVVFVSWLVRVLVVLGSLVVMGWMRICFLLLLVVLVVLLRIGFWGALKEFDSTEKHQHTLHELGTVRVLSLVPWFGRDYGFLGLIGVQFVILMCCMSVIMAVLGLLWVTGLVLDSLRLHWPTSPGYA